MLKDAGFAVSTDQAYSPTVAKGTVLAQTPPGGVYADAGVTIEITLSNGPAPANAVTIPDVKGMTQAEATSTLEAAGLVVEVLEAYSDTVPSGQVLGQAPSKGLQTAPGATVTIAVSKGPAATTLPASTTEDELSAQTVVWTPARIGDYLTVHGNRTEGKSMADLIAIGYDDTTTALAAMDEAGRLAKDLVIQPDAIAAIIRDEEGKYKTITNQHIVGGGATWGMFWGFFFGILFFVPVLGMAIGAGLGALFGKLGKSSIDKQFQDQVREQIKPGTSALFMILEQMTTDKALAGLSKFGGTVIKTSLSEEAEKEIQDALHGAEA